MPDVTQFTASPEQRNLLVRGNKPEGVEIFWTNAEDVNPLYLRGLMRYSSKRKGRSIREFATTTDKGRAFLTANA